LIPLSQFPTAKHIVLRRLDGEVSISSLSLIELADAAAQTEASLAQLAQELNVSLTSKMDDFVTEQVERGRYRSASEVVREGLRLLEVRESKLQNLQRQVEEGRASGYNSGRESMQRIRANLKKTFRIGEPGANHPRTPFRHGVG